MAIGNKQIGWSNESNLLWEISKQLDRTLRTICTGECPTTTSTTTLTPTTTSTTTEAPIIIYTYILACNSYTWDVTGDTYFDSDEYSYTEGNVTNILILTICSGTGAQFETQTISAVSPYTWPINGMTYTASGSYSTSIGPCADGGAACTYYLDLTIIP